MTNLKSLSDLFKAALKLAAVCAFVSAMAATVSAQTNTFPTTGNAGAGTTSPDRKLESLDSASPQLRLTHTDGSVYTDFQVIGSGHLLISPTGPDITGMKPFTVAADSDAFRFYPNADSNLRWALGTDASGLFHIVQKGDGWAGQGTRFTINRSGNVGIGTTSPGYLLTLNQTGNSVNRLLSLANDSSGSSAQAAVSFFEGATEKFKFGLNSSGATGYVGGVNAFQLWHFQNAPIVFGTNSTERMRVDGVGNVGIGTNNPTARFVIANGNFGLGTNSLATWTQQTSVIESLDTSIFFGTDTDIGLNSNAYHNAGWKYKKADAAANIHLYKGNIYFRTATSGTANAALTWTNSMFITSAGNVGIGTTTPNTNYKLDVNGEINATGIRINGTPISGGNPLWQGTGSIYYNAGNVGIGTATPGSKLHVYGPSGNDLFVGAYGNTLNFLYDNSGDDVSGWVNFVGYQGGTTKFRDFSIGNGKNTAIAFFDGSSGHVGIGTTSPIFSLDVNGGVNGFRAKAATSSSSDAIAVFENGSGIQAMVRGNGYVGIGTTSPAEKLEINGNVKLSGTGNLNAAGTIEAGNIKAKYQDLAEWVPSSEELASGTVVVLDTTKSNQVIASGKAYDTRVAGVISAQPGITLGESGEGKVLVATTGRVRVKVDASRGAIQIGDLLVTSDVSGVAMKSEAVNLGGVQFHRPGTIIGKALEPLAKGTGEILVLLSLQ